MSRLTVHTSLESYRAAVAELSASTARADDDGPAAGGIVVIDGSGSWCEEAERAAAAAALVIADPRVMTSDALIALRAAIGRVPVVVERPRLRPDAVADAMAMRIGAEPISYLAVDAASAENEVESVLRDAIGWTRALGGTLSLVSAADSGESVLALAMCDRTGDAHGRTEHPAVATITLGVASDDWRGSLLKVTAVGAVRTEVVVDDGAGIVLVRTDHDHGTSTSPRRWESSERVALRRAVQAVRTNSSTDDLQDLIDDVALVEAIRTHALHPAVAHKRER